MLFKVKTRIAEVQDQLAALGFKHINIMSVAVKRLRPGVSGLAYTRTNSIEISVDYMREHEDQMLARTVPHEVVHLYVAKYYQYAKQAHGPEFRRLMNALGCDNSTRHNMHLENGPKRNRTRYIYVTAITLKEVKLTPQQHNNMLASPDRYRLKGEKLKFANRVVKI